MEGVSERESILQNVNRKNQSVLKETNSIILLCIQSSFLGISQKIRFARVCAAAKYFISRSLPIASKPLTHSHRYHRFYKCSKRFYARNKELLFKYAGIISPKYYDRQPKVTGTQYFSVDRFVSREEVK